MTKDSTELEYKGEIYGRIWEAITWNEEERAYQHLTNALFMAAKEDIIAEKNETKKYVRKTKELGWFKVEVIPLNSDDDPFTKNLDKVIGEFCKDVDQEKREEVKKALKKELQPSYKALKDKLNDVRVLGVGNRSLEAVGKACKIFLKTMIGVVWSVTIAMGIAGVLPAIPILAGSAVVLAAAAAVAKVAMPAAIAYTSSSLVLPFAGNDSEILKNIRKNMKEVLEETEGPQKPKVDSRLVTIKKTYDRLRASR